MVQFQVTLAIGDIAVREYSLYDLPYLSQLKHYLLDYCLQRPKYATFFSDSQVMLTVFFFSLMKYVREQLVLAAALITKRSLFDNRFDDSDTILLHITELISMEAENAVRKREKENVEKGKLNVYVANTRSSICQCPYGPIFQHESNNHRPYLGTSSQMQIVF